MYSSNGSRLQLQPPVTRGQHPLDPNYKSMKFVPEAKKNQLIEYITDLLSESLTIPDPSAESVVKSEHPQVQSTMVEWLMGDIVDW